MSDGFCVDVVPWSSPTGRAVLIVAVTGEVDIATVPVVRKALGEAIAAGSRHLVLDLEGVSFLDSTGLGMLVGVWKRVRGVDGSLQLVCTQQRTLQILRITGLTAIFPIHESVVEAIAAGGPAEREGAESIAPH